MARKVRLFSICSVQLAILESKPPKLAVTVHGYAVSSGWTDPELVPLEKKLSADGILDLDFVATPPDAVSLPALTPATAETVWTEDVDRLVGVRVVSRTGDVIELLPPDSGQATTTPAAEETTQIAGEGPHPYWAAAAHARATTLAIGEETGPTTFPPAEEHQTNAGPRSEAVLLDLIGPMSADRAPATTMATGEETVFTTLALGEEGPPPLPTTQIVGEEIFDRQATTLPTGEETTQIAGEAHPGHVTVPTPAAPAAEENADHKPPRGEVASLPEAEGATTTAPQWEEMVSYVDFRAENQWPTERLTTLVVGEETVMSYFRAEDQPSTERLTTLVVGEETVGTRPWGETNPRWDNPKLPRGETSPHSDDPKPAFGETWFDPQDMNPLGRR